MSTRQVLAKLTKFPTFLSVHFQSSSIPASRQYRKISTINLERQKGDRERVVILGSGWAGQTSPLPSPSSTPASIALTPPLSPTGYGLSRQLSAKKYQTVVISPRSYFVFTPLLSSTAVGTLEFRTALEPVRNRRYPNVEFVQGWAEDVDFSEKTVTVEESVLDTGPHRALAGERDGALKEGGETKAPRVPVNKWRGRKFDVGYDKLVIAVGCYSHTFGTKGVRENAYFLKDVGDARGIRKRILECFEIAALPTTEDRLKRQLLNFAVIGGGPTGMEFSAELSDLVHEDMRRLYPGLMEFVHITVYDVAPKVLSMFDASLAKYAMETFRRENIHIKTEHHVEELRPGLPGNIAKLLGGIPNAERCYTLKTREEGEVGVGMCVWATGNMMNPFIDRALKKVLTFPEKSASLHPEAKAYDLASHRDQEWMIKKNHRTGAVVVDDHLRVQIEAPSPSAAAKVKDTAPPVIASMADVFALGDNAMLENANLPVTAQTANQQALWLGKRLNKGDLDSKSFSFKNMGIMTYLGNSKGLFQTGGKAGIHGRMAWLIWRGAYMTLSVSWRNKILIPLYW